MEAISVTGSGNGNGVNPAIETIVTTFDPNYAWDYGTQKEGLRENEVTSSKARKTVKGIERSIVHYGDTTDYFAVQLKKFGPAYASAVAMEEATLVAFNKGRTGTKLVALYPHEGTFYSDDPYIVLERPG
jgi:Ca-activated chloride channel family protein